mgnify:CR=1 FL=1
MKRSLLAFSLAVLNGAMADAGIDAWHHKYVNNLWRPVVGIRAEAAPHRDPFWAPLHVTEAAHALGAKVIAVHHGSAALDAAGMRGPRRAWEAIFRAWIIASGDPRVPSLGLPLIRAPLVHRRSFRQRD